MLFDSKRKNWSKSDMNKLQTVVDKAYQLIWNNGKGLALIRMEQEKTNMWEVRRQLQIKSIRTKIETRTLERIGHVIRMPNERIVKRVVMGQWTEGKGKPTSSKNNTINYWRRLLAETGIDWTNIENLALERKRWKSKTMKRMKFLDNWETEMCGYHRTGAKPLMSQRIEVADQNGYQCRWEGCNKVLRTVTGRTQHERRIHRTRKEIHNCGECNAEFTEKSALTNHKKKCLKHTIASEVWEKADCPECRAFITKTNMSRHRKTHNN